MLIVWGVACCDVTTSTANRGKISVPIKPNMYIIDLHWEGIVHALGSCGKRDKNYPAPKDFTCGWFPGAAPSQVKLLAHS
jgi:hypothetical protein